MKRDFYAVHAGITCPHCQVKQTGIERVYDMSTGKAVEFEVDDKTKRYEFYPDKQYAIKCAWSKCGQMITGDDLEHVTRDVIKSPSEIKSKL